MKIKCVCPKAIHFPRSVESSDAGAQINRMGVSLIKSLISVYLRITFDFLGVSCYVVVRIMLEDEETARPVNESRCCGR